MSVVNKTYRDGRFVGVTSYDPDRVTITDCREGESNPFIGVRIHAEEFESASFLPPELAIELRDKLIKLFPVEPLASEFTRLFGEPLTLEVLVSIANDLTWSREHDK